MIVRVITARAGPHPDPTTTPALLEVLRRRGARATFLLVGERASAHPEVIDVTRPVAVLMVAVAHFHR